MSTPQERIDYIGNELDLFKNAVNWKNYFARTLKPYVKGRVLDAGCGMGANAEYLWNERVTDWTFLEPDPQLLAKVKDNVPWHVLGKSTSINATTASLDPSLRFDTILYLDVIEHIEQSKEELARAFGLLSPGGRIVILVPAFNYLFSPFDKAIGHFRRYDKPMLRGELPAGSRLLQLKYLDSMAFFASLANKWFLGQKYPTLPQVLLWDRRIVPVSRLVDPIVFHAFGKSLIAVVEKP